MLQLKMKLQQEVRKVKRPLQQSQLPLTPILQVASSTTIMEAGDGSMRFSTTSFPQIELKNMT